MKVPSLCMFTLSYQAGDAGLHRHKKNVGEKCRHCLLSRSLAFAWPKPHWRQRKKRLKQFGLWYMKQITFYAIILEVCVIVCIMILEIVYCCLYYHLNKSYYHCLYCHLGTCYNCLYYFLRSCYHSLPYHLKNC